MEFWAAFIQTVASLVLARSHFVWSLFVRLHASANAVVFCIWYGTRPVFLSGAALDAEFPFWRECKKTETHTHTNTSIKMKMCVWETCFCIWFNINNIIVLVIISMVVVVFGVLRLGCIRIINQTKPEKKLHARDFTAHNAKASRSKVRWWMHIISAHVLTILKE